MAFSDNVWWTRKARIQAEKRLLSNAFHTQILLLWYSFSGVASAIYHLSIEGSNAAGQDISGITWVVFSVLVLCISGFINGLSFKERAGLIKECYETLNSFHQKAKDSSLTDPTKLSTEYDQILGVCENHSDRDYYMALCIEYVTNKNRLDKNTGLKKGLDRSPTWYHWFSLIYWTLCHQLMLTVLYLLPVILCVALRCIE